MKHKDLVVGGVYAVALGLDEFSKTHPEKMTITSLNRPRDIYDSSFAVPRKIGVRNDGIVAVRESDGRVFNIPSAKYVIRTWDEQKEINERRRQEAEKESELNRITAEVAEKLRALGLTTARGVYSYPRSVTMELDDAVRLLKLLEEAGVRL